MVAWPSIANRQFLTRAHWAIPNDVISTVRYDISREFPLAP